jgi:kinesin family protein 6/9
MCTFHIGEDEGWRGQNSWRRTIMTPPTRPHSLSLSRCAFSSFSNSMMTSVLRDSLGGNCKTVMIATMSGQRGHIDESISTCRFAQRVAMVRNAAFVNEEIDPKLVIKRLKLQVRELREELAAAQGQKGPERALDEDELQRCKQMVSEYLGSDKPVVEAGLPNRNKVAACFAVFKDLLLAAQQGRGSEDAMTVVSSSKALTSPSGKSASSFGASGGASEDELKKLRLMVSSRDNEIAILVSMLKQTVRNGRDIEILEDVRERAAKQAAKDTGIIDVNIHTMASPLQQSLLLSKGVQQLAQIHSTTSSSVIGATAQEDSAVLEQRLAAFEEFRRSYRKNQLIEEQKDSLKLKIDAAQRLGEAINACRNDINRVKASIESRRVARGVANLDHPEAAAEPDEEEEALKASIDSSKLAYRTHFNDLKDLKTEIEQLKHMIDRSRRKLQADFDTWWTAQNSNVARGGSKEQKQAQLRAASMAAAMGSGGGDLGATGSFQVHHAQSSPSPAPTRSYPSASGGLISGSMAIASPGSVHSTPRATYSTSGSSTGPPPAQRLLSTGNAQADADIATFYRMRDSLIQQQAQAAQQQKR